MISYCTSFLNCRLISRNIILVSLFISKLPISFSQKFDYLPTNSTGQVIHHKYFTLSYAEEFEQPEWVAYLLTDSMVSGPFKPKNDYRQDPFVMSGSSTPADYKGTSYAMGQFVPSGSMKFSSDALSETFLMSNITPLTTSFNRGLWKRLEELVQKWAVDCQNLYIITGPILHKHFIDAVIGSNKVSVPGTYYMIILDYTEPDIKAISFLLPNGKTTSKLPEFVISIDQLEALTGVDFFPALPDSIEAILESNTDITKWK